MPTLVAEILLGQLSPRELKIKLARKGDHRLSGNSNGGLGKGFLMPEAGKAFECEGDSCRVRDVNALYDLSLLFKNGRKQQDGKLEIHVNENKEAICLALIFVEKTVEDDIKKKVLHRLGELYSGHFARQKLPATGVLEHIYKVELARAEEQNENKKEAQHFEFSTPLAMQIEEKEVEISKSVESEQKYELPVPLNREVSEEKGAATTPLFLEIKEPTTPPPVFLQMEKVASPVSVTRVNDKNSYKTISVVLSTMNDRDVLPYDTESLAVIKRRQKKYLLSQMSSWNLDELRHFLRLMIKVHQHQTRDDRLDILRIESSSSHRLFDQFGATQSWQEIANAVKSALIEKLSEEKRAGNSSKRTKFRLQKNEYDIYFDLLNTRLGRFYETPGQTKSAVQFKELFEVQQKKKASRKRPH